MSNFKVWADIRTNFECSSDDEIEIECSQNPSTVGPKCDYFSTKEAIKTRKSLTFISNGISTKVKKEDRRIKNTSDNNEKKCQNTPPKLDQCYNSIEAHSPIIGSQKKNMHMKSKKITNNNTTGKRKPINLLEKYPHYEESNAKNYDSKNIGSISFEGITSPEQVSNAQSVFETTPIKNNSSEPLNCTKISPLKSFIETCEVPLSPVIPSRRSITKYRRSNKLYQSPNNPVLLSKNKHIQESKIHTTDSIAYENQLHPEQPQDINNKLIITLEKNLPRCDIELQENLNETFILPSDDEHSQSPIMASRSFCGSPGDDHISMFISKYPSLFSQYNDLDASPEQPLINSQKLFPQAKDECKVKTIDKDNKCEPCSSTKGRLGSDWVKIIQEKTPPKKKETTADLGPDYPDSTKKKIAKGGHASRVKALIQSWESDLCMWRHQTNLVMKYDISQKTIKQEIMTPDQGKLLKSKEISTPGHKETPKSTSQSSMSRKTRSQTRNISCDDVVMCSSDDSHFKTVKLRQLKRKSTQLSSDFDDILLNDNSPCVSKNKLQKTDQNFVLTPRLKQKLMSPQFSPFSHRSSLDVNTISSGSSLHENPQFRLPDKFIEVSVELHKATYPKNALLCSLFRNKENLGFVNNISDYDKFLVLFDIQGNGSLPKVGSLVKIFAPWQRLDLPSQKMPIIFTSYFYSLELLPIKQESANIKNMNTNTEEMNNEILEICPSRSPTIKSKKHTRNNLIQFSWNCSCKNNRKTLPALCTDGSVKIDFISTNNQFKDIKKEISNTSFNVVSNIQNSTVNLSKIWTVMEAIEKCGVFSDSDVYITLRIYRVYTDRSQDDMIEEYILIGQDPQGLFAVIMIPNRSMAEELIGSIQVDGPGKTYTFTKLSVAHRVQDHQNPPLFSLIWSLDRGYREQISSDTTLNTLLKDQMKRPRQSFIYVFTANVGLTSKILINEQSTIIPELPYFDLQEDSREQENYRGILEVNILYAIGECLYVVDVELKSKSGKVLIHDGVSRGANLVRKIKLHEAAMLPTWLKTDRTIMKGVFLKDVLYRKGGYMFDEYSTIETRGSVCRITLWDLQQILAPLSDDDEKDDLVLLKGRICDIDEENAQTWNGCDKCSSSEIEYRTGGEIFCLTCLQFVVEPVVQYYLVVEIKPAKNIQAEVIVQLYQRTSVKVMKSISRKEDEGYSAGDLKGKTIGPLVCIIKSTERYTNTGQRRFMLLELPY